MLSDRMWIRGKNIAKAHSSEHVKLLLDLTVSIIDRNWGYQNILHEMSHGSPAKVLLTVFLHCTSFFIASMTTVMEA